MPREATLNEALIKVNNIVRQNHHAQALMETEELLVSYPNAVRVWRARAGAFEAAGNPESATEAYSRVLEFLPADPNAMNGLARCLSAAGRGTEAAEIAKQALDYDPDDQALRRTALIDVRGNSAAESVGRIALAQGQFRSNMSNRAIQKIRDLLEQQPSRVDAQVVLAEMLWRNGQRVTASEICQNILDQQPDCLNAHAMLMALWKKMGSAEMVHRHAQAIDAIDPDHRETLALFGEFSPVDPLDVLANSSMSDRVRIEEDERDREDFVDDLIGMSSSPPPPITREPSIASYKPLRDQFEPQTNFDEDDPGEVTRERPLEWSSLDEETDDETLAEEAMERIDFVSHRDEQPQKTPQSAVTDEGVEIEPLNWSSERADENIDEWDEDDNDEPIVIERDYEQPDEHFAVQPKSEFVDLGDHLIRVDKMQPTTSIAQKRNRKGDDLLDAAREAMDLSEYDEAKQCYEQLITRGKLLDDVVGDLEAATAAMPNSSDLYRLLGMAYVSKGNARAGEEMYRKALAIV
jgi:tetratricopeptide (TPR) repeat protein